MNKFLRFCIIALLSGQLSFSQSALRFDALVPNYVEIGNNMNTVLAGTDRITVEAWCYLTANTFLPTIVGNYLTGMQFLLRVDNNRAAFWVDNGSGFKAINGSSIIPFNSWTHIAGVWDGNQLNVYVNGVLDGTMPGITGAFPVSSNPVRIGANLLSEAWTGRLDDIRIWTTALNITDINSRMGGCVTGTEPGLLAAYNFEEGTGMTVTDKTGHGYGGTLVNSPAWDAGLACTALPVDFVSIGAHITNTGVSVDWQVAEEQDVLLYEVERAIDGRHFVPIGSVAANAGPAYHWLDASVIPPVVYYRVRTVELSGINKYSAIVRLNSRASAAAIIASPNPVTGSTLNLQFQNQEQGRYTLQLVDAAGRVLLITSLTHAGGNSQQSVQLPARLSRGLYQLLVERSGIRISTEKLFIDGGR